MSPLTRSLKRTPKFLDNKVFEVPGYGPVKLGDMTEAHMLACAQYYEVLAKREAKAATRTRRRA
jgi:hypothetical protein